MICTGRQAASLIYKLKVLNIAYKQNSE